MALSPAISVYLMAVKTLGIPMKEFFSQIEKRIYIIIMIY